MVRIKSVIDHSVNQWSSSNWIDVEAVRLNNVPVYPHLFTRILACAVHYEV